MVGRPRVDRHRDVGRAGRPGDPAVEHLHAARGLDVVDPVDDLVAAQARERIAERPRDPGVRDRVGVDDAIAVLEARGGERAAHRPRDRVAQAVAGPDGRRRPVEVRRRVEVAGQERRDPGVERGAHAAERRAGRGHAGGALVAQDLPQRLAVPDEVRAVGIGREVLVGEREDLPRLHLREHVLPARAGRVDQRVARDDVEPVAPVRPAERLGDPARVPLRLLQADDVGVGGLDRADDAAEVDDVPAEPDVERHDPDVGGRPGCRGRGRGGAQRRRDDDRQDRRRAAHAARPAPAARQARRPRRPVPAGPRR